MPDEGVTAGNGAVDYDKLMQAIFNDAVGDEEAVVESETLTRRTDDGQISQTRSRKRPNVALAMKLLGERIGGPQDFC